MHSEMKSSYKFTDRSDWVNYVTTNMPKIKAQQNNSVATEIWVSSNRGILGKWCDEIGLGYIEEYRDELRLMKERIAYSR